MALTPCPHCGHPIHAPSGGRCPNCGGLKQPNMVKGFTLLFVGVGCILPIMFIFAMVVLGSISKL
jgi:hypothetical protein